MRNTLLTHAGVLSLVFSVVLAVPASAGLVFGPNARTQFEGLKTNVGGTFVGFDQNDAIPLPIGTNLTTQLSSLGVTFASITDVFGNPAGPFHVEVSNLVPNNIVGSPCNPFCVDDGRVGYEINFVDPQRWAGLERNWNPSTLTRFFNSSGTLLSEHSNTVNSEFVGFIADGADPLTQWVSRIQIDAIGFRQVGYSDDLFFGTLIPEPTSLMLLAVGTLGLIRRRC